MGYRVHPRWKEVSQKGSSPWKDVYFFFPIQSGLPFRRGMCHPLLGETRLVERVPTDLRGVRKGGDPKHRHKHPRGFTSGGV